VWLDGLHPGLLRSGLLLQLISDGAITGVTSHLAGVAQALASGGYDDRIPALAATGLADEALYHALALADAVPAADLLRPLFEASGGCDGWVSVDLSPLLADNTALTLQAAARLQAQAGRPNLLVAVPGTPDGLRAVEQATVDGVPTHVTWLFAPAQVQAAGEAFERGLARRLAAGLNAHVASVAGVGVAAWDAAVADALAPPWHHRLGLAMALRSYRGHAALLACARWQRLAAAGARPQRLLWAGAGAPGSAAPDTRYARALAAPDTLLALPEATLQAAIAQGLGGVVLPADGGYADAVLQEFRREGVDDEALAPQLQHDALATAALSWHATMTRLREKSQAAAAHAAV
jgi:transaldolase